jgi:hypothetical protein
MRNRLNPALLKKRYSFEEYVRYVSELVALKRTSGPDQNEIQVQYTKLNFQRTKRITKTLQLSASITDLIQKLESNMLWIVIVEAWCGDVPQNLPYMHAISELSDKITLKIILRDEHPQIMDQFLTNGSRSIPKLICLDPDTNEVAGTWGPRPAGAMEIIQTMQKDPGITKDTRNEAVQRWYLANKGMQLQSELHNKIEEWDLYLSNLKLREVG